MDSKSQERLDEILAKEPAALTEADGVFLRARASYLTSDQKAKFADELRASSPDSSEEEKPKKKDSKN